MKLSEITMLNEGEDSGKRLTDEELEIIFKYIKPTDLNIKEIKDLSKEIVANHDDYKRKPGSALFALTRMHSLVHGVVPAGVTAQTAKTWFNPGENMKRFIRNKGYDVEDNTEKAKREVSNRPVKVRKDVARDRMSDYYYDHKDEYVKDIGKNSTDIIDNISDGMSVEKALEPYKKG